MANKKLNFTFICFNNKDKSRNVTHVEGVDTPSFECPRCGLQLVWMDDDKGKKFGAHGKSDADINHELRKVEEVR